MQQSQSKQQVGGILGFIERIGNKIPDITILFISAFILVCVVSAVLAQIHFNYVHPATGRPIEITNMLSGKALVDLMSKMVTNYANFPPLSMVIVATLGIGIADGSGYINTGLKKILSITPKVLITPVVILVGMLSHLGPDSGYVIIIPIAAYMFYAVGKHPLAVNVLCNYFYAFASTFIVIGACWWVTDKITNPWLWKACPLDDDVDLGNENNSSITPSENRAFKIATAVLLLMLTGLAAALYPADSILRAPDGVIASFKAPIMQSIVSLIFIFAALVGLVYGIACGKFKSPKDVTAAMEEITKTLVQLIVFYFFAAQFLYAFGASNMGALIAVSGAEFLKSLNLPPQVTVFGIIVFVALLNLIITSASAKWAILAPIFVPMLMAVGIAPELTQVAFRVSDSAVNVVTPMFAFYPLIILYCQKYVKNAGIGTLSSMMLPYTIALLVSLTFMLYLFWWLDIPLGFQADYVYPRRF